MIWTFLVLGLWIVLGGFIAYYGDLQGRRWGKKRVSKFGLRPKHTAVLITSLTGGFIALLSIITLLLIAPDIRDVVLHDESAIRENRRLIAEESKERLQMQRDRESFLADTKLLHEQKNQQAQEDQKQLARGRQQLQQEQAKLQPLKDRVQALQASVKALQARFDTLLTKNNALQKKNNTLQAANLVAIQDNIREAAINKAYADQNYKYGVENLALEKTNKTLQASNNTLQQINDHLKKINDTFTRMNEDFYQKNVALEKEINEKTQEVAQLNQQVQNLNQESDEAQIQIRQRTQLLTKLADMYSVVRQGQVRLRAGVELSRQEVDAHLRPEAVKKQLQAMLDRAVAEAKAYGAASDSDGSAARLLPQKKITLTGTEEADETSQIEALAQQWSGSDVSFVVVASTVTNCLEGEPVYLQLHFYPVRRVYSKGAVVAVRQIDGHEPVEKIINNLFAFLQKDVQQAALRDGIIPKIDPETGQSEVGVAGWGELVGIFERVRRMHGPVLLTAKAKRDLSSADPLSLTFHVDRVKVEPTPPSFLP